MTLTSQSRRTDQQSGTSSAPYRVMVVDDSAVIRGFLTRYLEEDGAIKVVATASNGLMALRALETAKPEVVVLDIEMPEMDGMTALPKIIAADPEVKVVMASTLTLKNAEISLRAIQMGAADYVPKPETTRAVNANIDFRQELVEKVKVYGAARRRSRGEAVPTSPQPAPARGTAAPIATRPRGEVAIVARRGGDAPAAAIESLPLRQAGGAREIVLRSPSRQPVELLMIGSSTGGPQALMKLLAALGERLRRLPVLIVQHMPATFTPILAEHLGRASGLPSAEAKDGEQLVPGRLFIAPGNHHMTVERAGAAVHIRLDQSPPENFCRPAVDPMLRSLAKSHGGRALAVILTGMGHDGLRGAREFVQAGGTVLAQDEATSVVWGMPGAVATAGLCTAVVPLDEMAGTVAGLLGVGR